MGVFKLGGLTLKSLFSKRPTRRYPYKVRETFENARGQIDMIDIQRRAIQIVDIKRQPRRIKNNYREETMSAVMTVVAMGLVVVLGIATWVIFGY